MHLPCQAQGHHPHHARPLYLPDSQPHHHQKPTPTFGAEISGVNFSQPGQEEVFDETLAAITQVGPTQNKIA